MLASLLIANACFLCALSPAAPQVRRSWPDDIYERLVAHPPMIRKARLPQGSKIGRCLLVVDGRTRISGKCVYRIYKGGAFLIDGPRQVYDGLDYPKAEIMAAMISTDYWANVSRNPDGSWTGGGNENVGSVHEQGDWGPLTRKGACYSNRRVRVCLWKK